MKHWHENGFTLIELMITLLVAAVIFGVGIPNFREFIANNRMATAANDFISALHIARSEAIKRRTNVSICPSANWDAANPTCNNGGRLGDGMIVFVDCSAAPPAPCGAPNLAVDGADQVISARGPLPNQIANLFATDAGGVEYLTYGPNGFPRNVPGFNAGIRNIQLCDDRGDHDTGGGIAAGRWLQITPTGRPQIYRNQNFVQSANNPLNGC
ncbi:MAG TPA: prepilin-type N-terminal cleavage/methylation domain-containing protein [Chromatiales bacterium]|nr:prepilin-type N-terminal cleavage/methylation domain-containing protein [Chromatiales bacterium]